MTTVRCGGVGAAAQVMHAAVVGDRPQRAVGGTIPTAVQPVPDGLARRGLDRAGAAHCGEGGLAVKPVGVVAGGDQRLGGGLHADAVALQQPRRGAPDRPGDCRIQAADLRIQGQPAAAQAAQGQPQARGGGKLGAGASQGGLAQRAQPAAELVVAVDQQRAELVVAWVRALMALRRATTSARSYPAAPLRSLERRGRRRPAPRGLLPGRRPGVLPVRRRRARSGRLTSTTLMPWSLRCWASR
jgi:hypothetical protein